MAFREILFCGTLIAFVGVGPSLLAQTDALPAPLGKVQQQAGYGIGFDIGTRLAKSGLDESLIDVQALLLGIRDAMASQKPRVPDEQVQAALKQVDQIAMANVDKKMKAFVSQYKARDGVRSLPSGVLYRVMKSGRGATPKATDHVKTHYRGRLYDGTEFDSSYKRNEPAVFPVNGVIRGWTEALQQMKVGDQWQLVIPPEMGYGKQGSPPVIPPNAVLVFEIELLEVVQNPGQRQN